MNDAVLLIAFLGVVCLLMAVGAWLDCKFGGPERRDAADRNQAHRR